MVGRHRPTFFVLCGALWYCIAPVDAAERSAAEFKAYAERRLADVDASELLAFVEKVDKDGDGAISDDEFRDRITAFQEVFKSKVPKGGSRHGLPENWSKDFAEARKQSEETGKPLVAMFSTSWCGPCKMMIARVFPTAQAKEALESFVPVYVDSEKHRDLAGKYEIRAFPTFVCLEPGGKEAARHVGAGNVEKFAELLADFSVAVAELSSKQDEAE